MAKQGSTPKVITKKHLARIERERRQTRLIIGIVLAGILAVVGLITYGYLKENVLQQREPVAEVNGEKITSGDWQERVRFQRAQMINIYNQYEFYQKSFGFDYSQQLQEIQFSLQAPDVLGEQVLDQLIDEALIRQEAERRGITVSEEELEQYLQENYNFFPNGTPTPTVTPTEVSFPTLTSQQLTLYPSTATATEVLTATPEATATLDPSMTATPTATAAPASPTPVPQLPTATATPYTLEGFQSEYENTLTNLEAAGIGEKTYRAVYKAGLLRRKLRDEIAKDTPRSEEQVWARHILVEKEADAKAIIARLNQGIDFVTLAKQYSKDTGSGANGGDLGWFGKGAMVPEFEQAAFDLEVGEISEPVKSQFGYHVIQALGHQERPLDASQYDQKKETKLNDWLASEREKATITKFDIWKDRVPMEPNLPVTQ